MQSSDLVEQHKTEQKIVIRTILMKPLLTLQDNEKVFYLLRKHSEELKKWFYETLGYHLFIRSDHARLIKKAPNYYNNRPAKIKPNRENPGSLSTWNNFTKKHYIHLALILAALETTHNRTQILLSTLSTETKAIASELEIALTFSEKNERKAFSEAIEWLIYNGVLKARDGNTNSFIENEKPEEALLDINYARLGDLKGSETTLIGKTTSTQLYEEQKEHEENTTKEQTQKKQYFARLLIEEPVVYIQNIPEKWQKDFIKERKQIAKELEEKTGLQAEHRAEGSLLSDELRTPLTDIRMPSKSNESQLSILLLEKLENKQYTQKEIKETFTKLWEEHKKIWSKENNEEQLLENAINTLTTMKLIKQTKENNIEILPAASRYITTQEKETKKENTAKTRRKRKTQQKTL